MNSIPSNKIRDWLAENKVLSLAFDGNIDQLQYCEKMKAVIEFLGNSLSDQELTSIWGLQQGRSGYIIDNIHHLIAAAAVNFTTNLMEHLLDLINRVCHITRLI